MEHKDKPSGRPSDVESAFAREARITVASMDLEPEVRQFAQRQVFSRADKVELASGPPRSFDRVVAELHDSDINVGMHSFCWCGMRVWIGDPLNGTAAEASFGPDDRSWMSDGSLAEWLHETALRLYPDSGAGGEGGLPPAGALAAQHEPARPRGRLAEIGRDPPEAKYRLRLC